MRVLMVVYDNGAYMHHFPMGLGYIAAILEKEGYEVDVYSQDMHHYPDEHLKGFLDENHYDVVCISLIAGYYQYQRLIGLSRAINDSKNRPFYILGGYGPTPEPEYFMKVSGADCIVMGEGEETAVELFAAIKEKRHLGLISGIAYKENGKCVVNPRRGVVEDLSSIPWPAYHRFPMEYYRLIKRPGQPDTEFTLPMMSARGCTFKCTFCYRMDPGYRAREGDELLAEVEFLYKEYGVTRISFMDDLMMTSIAHTEEICRAFEKANLPVTWDCNGRLNYCTPELLQFMKRAGCVFINYGIEAMDDNVLKLMKKGLRTEQVVKGVEWTLEAGISPGLNMLFGNLGDTKETLQKAVDFLIEYDDQAQRRTIRPVTPYPGSPLYHMAIEQGMLEGPEDFYERKHLNSDLLCCNFTELTDDEVYECLEDANKQLAVNFFNKNRDKALEQIEYLYREKDTSFRGFRQGMASQGKSKPAASLTFGAVASDSM